MQPKPWNSLTLMTMLFDNEIDPRGFVECQPSVWIRFVIGVVRVH